MPNPVRARRPGSARMWAERFGVTPRTIFNTVAEEREVYLARARERQQRIRDLRATGMTMRAIAEEVGVSVGAVHYAIHKEGENKLSQGSSERSK